MPAERADGLRKRRARLGYRGWLVAVLAAVLLPGLLHGQVPGDTVPAEPTPGDTILVPIPPEQVPADTLPTAVREAATSEAIVPVMPPPISVQPMGWAAARWEWDREAILRQPGATLLELVEQLPGFYVPRAGGFGRPMTLTASGLGGGRMRVFLDGFELDPIGAAAFELERIALLDLNSVRIERSPAELRIHLETFRLPDPEPYSHVELGTGAFGTRLLRALFSRGLGDRSIATGAFDLASTAGIGIREGYRQSSGVLRWAFAPREGTGVQLEWRRTAADREGAIYPLATTRSDLSLRARSELFDGFLLEGVAGRSRWEDDREGGVLQPLGSVQGGVRGAYEHPLGSLEAGMRLRGRGDPALPLPGLDLESRALVRPVSQVALEVTARAARAGNASAAGGDATIWVAPFPAATLFATLGAGERLVPLVNALPVTDPDPDASPPAREPLEVLVGDASGLRAGVELAHAGATLGVAALRVPAGPVAPLGLPFDRGVEVPLAPAANGIELLGRVPLPRTGGAARLEGWYQLWGDGLLRPYLPDDYGRLSLAFHDVFVGGQFEPIVRIDLVRRGNVLVPFTPGATFDTALEPYHVVNFFLQLRILDVQLYAIWDNLLNEPRVHDVPGTETTFPRIIYGGRWHFRN